MSEECCLMTHRSSESLRTGLQPGAKSNYAARLACVSLTLASAHRCSCISEAGARVERKTFARVVSHRGISGQLRNLTTRRWEHSRTYSGKYSQEGYNSDLATLN